MGSNKSVALSFSTHKLCKNNVDSEPALVYCFTGFLECAKLFNDLLQVCKLMMVIDELSGSVPDGDILTFVKVSFRRIRKAFTLGNANLMRHIVDFFRDAKENEHGRNVLLTYTM